MIPDCNHKIRLFIFGCFIVQLLFEYAGSQPVAGVQYFIKSTRYNCFLLNPYYNTTASKSWNRPLSYLAWADTRFQSWYVAQVPGTSNYVILNVYSNLALDSMGGNVTQQQLTCSSTQQVTIESTSTGTYFLHMNSGLGDKVLSDTGQNSTCSQQTNYISLQTKVSTDTSQIWSFVINNASTWNVTVANCPSQPVAGTPYYLTNARYGCVLESPGSDAQMATIGNRMVSYQSLGLSYAEYFSQNWYVAQVPGTSNYVIVNAFSNLALDSNGSIITQQPLTCSPSQQVTLESASNGAFFLHMNNGTTDLVVSDIQQVAQCTSTSYSSLQQKNASDFSQIWSFVVNVGSTWTPVSANCPFTTVPITTTTVPITTTTTEETTVTTVAETTGTTPPGTRAYACAYVNGTNWIRNSQWCFATGNGGFATDFLSAEQKCQQGSNASHLPYIYDQNIWNAFSKVRQTLGLTGTQVWLGCYLDYSSHNTYNYYWTTATQVTWTYSNLGNNGQYCYSDKSNQKNKPPSYNWYLSQIPGGNLLLLGNLVQFSFICMMDATPVIVIDDIQLTASPTNVEVNQPVTFSLPNVWGSDPTTTYLWNFNDGTPTVSTIATAVHSFTSSGLYNVTVTVKNAVSGPFYASIVIDVLQKCSISSITYPTYTATNYMCNLTVILDRGTNCTVTIDYGDGTPVYSTIVIGDITSCLVSKAPCNANGIWLINTPHNYTDPLKRKIKVTATNVITAITNTSTIYVQTIITGFKIVYPTTYMYIPYGTDLTVVFQATTGSHWNFNFWIAASTLTPTWNNDTMNGTVTVKKSNILVGPQILYLTVSNTISNQSLTYSFQEEYLFQGFSYQPNPTYLQTGIVYSLTFSFTQASHFNYTITLGNGVQTSANQFGTIIWNNNLTLLYNPFTYTSPNIYLVTITVFNHVQTQVYTFNATVQNPVDCIKYSTSSPGLLEYTLTSSAPVVFTLTFSSTCPFPTTAYYNYDYGVPGGTKSVIPFLNQPTQNQTYSYYRFGTFNTSVYIYNNISSLNFSLPVIVVVQFENVAFNTSRYQPQIGTEPHAYYIITNETILFKTTMSDGSNYNLTWSFGDGQSIVDQSVCYGTGQTITELSVCTTVLKQNHSYAMEGFYNASITLANAAVWQRNLLPIPFDPLFIVVQDVIRCFNIKLIEGNQLLIPFANISAGSWLHLEIYTNPSCGLKVGTTPRYIIDWGDGNPWQNNSMNSTAFNTSANCYDLTLPHNYLLSNTYNLNVTIWNEVSHVYFNEVIIVYQQVHATGIMTRWINENNQEIVGYKANDTQGYFALEYPVIFHALKSFGTYEQYNWTFSDGWDAKSLNDTIVRKFTQHGTVQVTVTINNNLAAGNFTFTVILERSIANVTLWDNSPWPRNYTSWHEYRLSTGVVPTDACYFLNFNDTDPQAECNYNFYGELSVCQEFFPTYYPPNTCALTKEVNTSYLEGLVAQGIDPNITWNHRFWTLGRKPVEVYVINHVSSMYFIYDTYVTRGPCQFPIPSVRTRNTCTSLQKCMCFQLQSYNANYTCPDTVTMNDGDRVSYVKDNLLIDADTSVNCTSSPQVWFNWTLTEIDTNGNEIADTTVQYLSNSRYYGFDTKILTVAAKQIPPGRYHFVLTVSPSLEIDMEKTDDTYIYIESSPLIAAFGSVDAYYVQQSSSVLFDAWTNSYDPDAVDDPKSNLSFSFYCRRACESWPPPNQRQVYTDWPNYNHSACDILDGGTYKIAGCFNSPTDQYPGPRPLDVNSSSSSWKQIISPQGLPGGNITLNTQAMTAGQWYSLLVVVNKQGDTRVSFQETMFYINKVQIPTVSFNCITNCQTDTFTLPGTSSLRQYRRVNPTSRFSIEAVIDGFALNQSYIYEWDLIGRPSGIANLQFDISTLPEVPDSDWLYKATTNRTLRTMSVEENLWNSSNNAAGFYFRLNFWIGKNQTAEPMGVYYYEFFLNTPPNPTDGYCKFNNPTGVSLDTTFGIYCDNFRDSQSGDLYYYVKQRLDPTSLFWIDSGSSQSSQMLDKTVHISAISGPEELNFNSEFMVRIIDSSGSSIMLDISGPVEPFDYNSPYYYNPVYSIFNYTESCPGCQLEDYFLTKTKEQKTSEISAIARTFSSMLNKNPSTGCPLIAPCDNTTVNCTALEMEAPTTVDPDSLIPSDMQALIQKHLGPSWTLLNPCVLDLKLRINLRERMTTTFSSLQIPYFSSFVQVVSALYPVTLTPQENTIQIMSGVQTCLAKGVEALDGVDPQMNMELEADIREEACTGLISVVSNMERTTNYYGAIWRDELVKYYPNFNMLGLLAEIQADEGINFTTAGPNAVNIWEMDPEVYVDNDTLAQLNEIRNNITLIHIVLDKIYALKTIITNFVQARKAMGESPSILLTENITAIYHKTPTKNMTGFPVVADCGCQFIAGDATQMFGNLDSADESVQAGAECGKNNPFTTDVSAKNLTGYTVTMSFQNSTGAIPISGLATPIDAFVPRKIDESFLSPIRNTTQPFSQPLLIYRFQMPKYYGLSLLIYDGFRGLPPDNSTDSNSTNGTDVESTTHTVILTTTKLNLDTGNETNSETETIKVLPKFALFIKFWTTFSIASATPYDTVCVLPTTDDVDDNATCTSTPTPKGNPRMCTVSYDTALKAAASDTVTTGDFVNVFVAVQSIPDGKTLDDFQKTTKIASFSDSQFKPVDYTLYSILADCKYYDTNTKQWKHDGTEVGPLTTVETTHCLVTHLTSFSSGFSLPINDLNLEDSGFKHLAENPIAFVFCLCIICLYLILCVWCRRKDKEDLVKAGIAPLPDNDPEDKYLYQIVFYTGTKANAGTTAKIYFILTGENEETDPRSAEDLHRAAFRRNGIDTFIMAVPRSLGKLTHLRIWHDNTGKSPSWYFKRMQVLNVQTGEQYFFICDRWLAVEEGDGQLERVIPVAGKNDLTAFDQLFFAKTQKNLFDGHIWFSVFRRPPRSSFTRVQRLTCCLSLIYCTMVANIMFFGTAAQQSASAVLISVGPITVTTATFMVAIVSGLVVVPVNTALVLIFRYARPPPAKTPMKEYEQQMKYHKKVVKKEEKKYNKEIKREAKQQGKKGLPKQQNEIVANPENVAEHNLEDVAAEPVPVIEEPRGFKPTHEAPEQPKIVKIDTRAKKKFSLPHWWIYIGYILAFCTVGVGFWLIVQFAFGFGREKAITWVIAMFVSLIQSIIFVQPIKILCLAIVYSLLCKKPEKDEYEPEEIELREDEVYMHGMYSVNDLYDPAKRREMRLQLKKSRNVIPPEMQAVKDARERK